MKRSLSRDMIKVLAVVAMTLCHISQVFLVPGACGQAMRCMGSFTAAVMCWFVTEGVEKTSSPVNYAKRLMFFAVLSQIPYCLAFTKDRVISWQGLNMIYSLLMVMLMVFFLDTEPDRRWRILYTAAAAAASLAGDWSPWLMLFTLLFVWAGKDRTRMCVSFLVSFAVYSGSVFFHRILFGEGAWKALAGAAGEGAGILAAGCLICFVYNGKRGRFPNAGKWFFYVYYPLHLAVIGIIRILLMRG